MSIAQDIPNGPSITLPKNQEIPSLPSDRNHVLVKLLKDLNEYVDYSQIPENERLILKDNFSKINSNYYNFTRDIESGSGFGQICETCKSEMKIKHKCKQMLCGKCMKTNETNCKKCFEALGQKYLDKLFQTIKWCERCSHKRKAYTECLHLCYRCTILSNEIICSTCSESYNRLSKTEQVCFGCHKMCNSVKDRMVDICDKHFVCANCAWDCIVREACFCGRILSPMEIYAISEYILGRCRDCKDEIVCVKLMKRNCCSNFVCEVCFGFPCEVCMKPSFDLDD
ncbi:hypothetical protein SteCoe_15882 [Stentor coeruleus]|uniref:Uncharacterized protein n=1 Tax=Stentor coeruleus TaxID=5963 RepID=A0A1R2C2M4_9CILI|nr:hypothetical protein SteCoe_15882 [Stentor coeruleus]